MAEGNPISPDTPIFDATITPQRSLSARGLFWLMMFMGGVGLAVSIPFYLMGAWPVLGFMGLDILMIYLAFRYHNATACGYERLVLTRVELLFQQVSWRGAKRHHRFNPAWVRLVRKEHAEFGIEKLELVEGRRRIELAAALGREERGDFAGAFQQALSDARR